MNQELGLIRQCMRTLGQPVAPGPLGMKTAYIRGTQPDVDFATGYTRFSDGTFHKCPEINLKTSDSAGGGAMTASDVVA